MYLVLRSCVTAANVGVSAEDTRWGCWVCIWIELANTELWNIGTRLLVEQKLHTAIFFCGEKADTESTRPLFCVDGIWGYHTRHYCGLHRAVKRNITIKNSKESSRNTVNTLIYLNMKQTNDFVHDCDGQLHVKMDAKWVDMYAIANGNNLWKRMRNEYVAVLRHQCLTSLSLVGIQLQLTLLVGTCGGSRLWPTLKLRQKHPENV